MQRERMIRERRILWRWYGYLPLQLYTEERGLLCLIAIADNGKEDSIGSYTPIPLPPLKLPIVIPSSPFQATFQRVLGART